MDFPVIVKDFIESKLEGYKLDYLKDILDKIFIAYKTELGKGKNIIDSEEKAYLYATYRMPATFGAVSDALKYTLDIYKEEIHSLLDVGSGTGSATLAAVTQLKLDEIVNLERNKFMNQVSSSIYQFLGLNQYIKKLDFDLTFDEYDSPKDLVIASYVLNELELEQRHEIIAKLWQNTSKVLIITEIGTPEGYMIINWARDYVLQNGGYIIAPCTHHKKCPMPQLSWCHFYTRIQRSKMHKSLKQGDAPFEDEKYCFIAFSKTKVELPKTRIIRHPNIYKSGVGLVVCDENGINEKVIYKRDKELYKKARKSKGGDVLD